MSRGIRGGGFVGSGGVGSVFRTSRGAESFDFDLAGKHPLAHVVNNGLQGHRPRKANRLHMFFLGREKKAKG